MSSIISRSTVMPRKPPTYTHRRAVTIPNSGGKRKFVVGHGSTLTRAKADSQRLVNEWLAKHQAGGVASADSERRKWYRALEKAGLPKTNPHAMRHTAASLMLEAGVPESVVSKVLGHKNDTITKTTYIHPDKGMVQDALQRLARIINESGG